MNGWLPPLIGGIFTLITVTMTLVRTSRADSRTLEANTFNVRNEQLMDNYAKQVEQTASDRDHWRDRAEKAEGAVRDAETQAQEAEARALAAESALARCTAATRRLRREIARLRGASEAN